MQLDILRIQRIRRKIISLEDVSTLILSNLRGMDIRMLPPVFRTIKERVISF